MLYKNVIALCEERKIAVSKLEKTVGLGNGTIRGWDKSSARIENVKAVADYFGVSVDSLLSNSASANKTA